MPNVDQHTRILIDDYLVITIESFLIDRKPSGRAKGTVAFYELKLRDFSNWCDHNEIKQISQITADDLRRFQLEIQEKHNPGGQSTYYRALKAFLRWVEFEDVMPATWKNPIKKIKASVVDLLPLTHRFSLSVLTVSAVLFVQLRSAVIQISLFFHFFLSIE